MFELVSQYGLFLVFLVIFCESMGLPLPGETTLIIAAVLIGHGTAPLTPEVQIRALITLIACGAGAAILGDATGYWLGRHLGLAIALRHGARIGLTETRLKLGRYLFWRFGGLIVFFGRFIALLRIFAGPLAGLNAMPFAKFLFYNASGCIIWATIISTGGHLLGRAIEDYVVPASLGLLAFIILGTVVSGRFVAYHEKELTAKAELAFPGPLEADV